MKITNLFKKKPVETQSTVSVKMPDGTIEQYPVSFCITDNKHCVSDKNSNLYHTHFDCPYLLKSDVLIGWKKYDAEASGLSKCHWCDSCEER